MAQTSSPVSGVADRYAQSLFDLAREDGSVDAVEGDLDAFGRLIDESADLRRLVESPAFSADDQTRAIGAVVDAAGPAPLTGNFLRVVAGNRRLGALPGIIARFRQLASAHRGEADAEVTSAHALNETQRAELKGALDGYTGKRVVLRERVDPAILGGLVVRIGSRQIDTSLRTKLSSLKLALKEVG